MNVISQAKQTLFHQIRDLEKDRELYLSNPKSDFTRIRKLDFLKMIRIFLSMEAGSINQELLTYFNYKKYVTDSAFCQQRNKIKPVFFRNLFLTHAESLKKTKTYKDYQLLACDGSTLRTPIASKDPKYLCQGKSASRGTGYLHLTALYDVLNQYYVDADILPDRKHNEKLSLIKMLQGLEKGKKTILIADRGFESYNVMAHVNSAGHFYLIRIKDNSPGGFMHFLDTPDKQEFDVQYKRKFVRNYSRKYLQRNDTHISIRHKYEMDFFTPEHGEYEMDFRIVRTKIAEDSYECLVTNLPKDEFSAEDLKELYNLRWGIETSFRDLKYSLNLNHFHGKKEESVIQEIYARMIMFNFCKSIITKLNTHLIHKKYEYRINFKITVPILQNCLRTESPPFSETIKLLIGNVSPVRPGRKFERKIPKTLE